MQEKKEKAKRQNSAVSRYTCVADWGCPQRGSRHQRSYRRAGAVRVQWQAPTRRRRTLPRRWPVPVARQPSSSVRRVPLPPSTSRSATPIREAASASRPAVRRRRLPASRIYATRRRPRWIPCGRPSDRGCCSCRAKRPSHRTTTLIIIITTITTIITIRTRRRRAVHWNRRAPRSAARHRPSSPLIPIIPIIPITITTTTPSRRTTITTTTITAVVPPLQAVKGPWTTFSKD